MSSQHGKTISNIAIIGGGPPAGIPCARPSLPRAARSAIFHTDKRRP